MQSQLVRAAPSVWEASCLFTKHLLMCLFFLISIATLLGLGMLTFFNLINYLSISYVKFNYCKLRAVYLAGRSAWKLTWGWCYPVGKTGSPVRPSFATTLLCDLREVPVL